MPLRETLRFPFTAAILCAACVIPVAAAPQHDQTLFTSVSPRPGERIAGKTLEIAVGIAGSKVERNTLEVRLNGKIITNLFRRNGKCENDACEESALVNESDGLFEGTNQVRFRIETPDGGKFHYRRVQFVWQKKKKNALLGVPPVTSVSSGTPPSIYGAAPQNLEAVVAEMSPAYGFSTLYSGGQQTGKWWLQTYNNALRGGGQYVFPAASGMCNTRYQIVLVDRKSMTWLDPNAAGYTPCVDSSADLKTQLGQVKNSQTAIVGTVYGYNADAGLDTTPIGGTDYSKVASTLYPQGYMMVGVGAAPAGTALESFYVPGESTTPHMEAVFARSPWGNYDIHPSDNILYTVDSVNKRFVLNGTTYSLGNEQVIPASGYWMVQFNRYDFSQASGFGCNSHACGEAYDASQPDQMQKLVNDLKNASQRNLIFLIAWGQQPGFTADTTGQSLAQQLNAVGASIYAAQNMTNATDSFAMITSTDPQYSKTLGSAKVMFSSTANTNQGQKGQLTGVLSRNNHYLYQPLIGYQEDLTVPVLQDFSAPVIAWQQPQPWPVMDTQGRQAAYMYVSYQLFQLLYGDVTNKPSGNPDDVRYFYTDSTYNLTMTNRDKLKSIPTPANATSVWANPVDGNTYVFSQQDFTDVVAELDQEFNNVQLVYSFLGYNGGQNLGNTLAQGTGATVYSMLANADAVRKDLNAPDSTSVGLSMTDMLTIASGITNAAGALATDGLSNALGVITGLLGSASGMSDASQGGAPTQDYQLYMAESQLMSDLQKNVLDIKGGYDTMLDNLLTDAGKLNQAAAKVTTTWHIKDQVSTDPITSFISAGSSRYYYLTMLPVFYSIDSFPQMSTTDINKLGSSSRSCTNGNCYTSCARLYLGSSNQNAYKIWKALPNQSQSDIRWIGGAITGNETEYMSEKFPTDDLVNILLGTDTGNGQLNLPADQFFTLSPLTIRVGKTAPAYNGNQTMCFSPDN